MNVETQLHKTHFIHICSGKLAVIYIRQLSFSDRK